MSDPNVLRNLASENKVAALKKAIAAGASIDAVSGYGDTALYAAAANGHLACVKVLIDAGANVDLKAKSGATALWSAVYSGRTELALALLAAGASPGPQSPLHKAVQKGNVVLVKALLEANAPLGKATRQGLTERDYLKQVKGPAQVKIAALLDAAAGSKTPKPRKR
jgi:ankyrin repeat protein